MKRHLPTILLLGCAALLAAGLIQLIALRFEVGDVYPPYSSLRSDPLGAMVLYESLQNVDALRVQRDFSTANRLPGGLRTTYLHIATSIEAWQRVPDDGFAEIERFIAEGGRLVITMFPQARAVRLPPVLRRAEADPEAERDKAQNPSLWSRWHLTPGVIDLDSSPDGTYKPVDVVNETALPLPSTLAWHSGIVFENFDLDWQPIYARGDGVVMLERQIGLGSVVIATDSYFLSNEAMLRDRHPDLLAWVVGGGANIFFDEAHLGVVESPGVATLMRRYRLHGFIAALILLTALFVWKNAFSLIPAGSGTSEEVHLAGRDSFAGFVNLLRRGVPAGNILAASYTEWKKSASKIGRYSAARLKRAEEAFKQENSRTGKDRDPVRAYQTIARILNDKRTHEH
jgi:hypothetical protein